MEKIISKLMYAVLALIVLACALIVLYAKSPDIAQFIKNTADEIPKPVITINLEEGETEVVMESAAANSARK
ncbi:hypothetical protein SAMN02910275_01665 [Butyrivibrio sp. INlla18]|uniref:hypothetical protein n=1 Tax=Butyrivibrio sp. INlla18 TaxID=1520806 RepID=UPI00088657A3|nr:hypothetical protein [Butyrivibrio sp. INlla18]SDA62160.1 hypothetical protein SAMN02910275_01665 [Butyrivibrio sp. INlla18]